MSEFPITQLIIATLAAFLLQSCSTGERTTISSPDDSIQLRFFLSEEGAPGYTVSYRGETVIDSSGLGYEFKNLPPLTRNMEIASARTRSYRDTWSPIWGERSEIENHYNELLVKLKEREQPHRILHLRFRAFDDGIGFRYEMPLQKPLADSLFIMKELTQFNLTGDHTAWWIPADYDSYEYVYETTKVSNIDASKYAPENERVDRRIANFHAVNTPVTMKTDNGVYLSFHEANLTDYAGMTLAVRDGLVLESELVPWADGTKVKTKAPFVSPWRTIQIGSSPGDLLESGLILNLNEPNKLDDTSWIQPMKYTGIWWELHIGKTAWGMGELAEGSFGEIGGKNKHGATTENAREYIDFTARAGLKGVLVEGWNTGWEYWGTDSLGFFDFTTSYPDFDLQEVAQYAKEHGVELIGHHETSGQAAHYQTRLDTAFALYQSLGVNAVKTGYAGGIIPKRERHHGQYMVRHYRTVVETAASYNITVNAHEPIKATGIRRTYPNMMTREGVRGMEYNAWSEGNPPEHTTILPFTRGLSGPMDYTPGIFDITFDEYREKEQVHSTLANQLALYVVLYSPVQMAADMPENYLVNGDFHPAFQFIREVAVDWDESLMVNGQIGDFVTIARKEKGTEHWFVGSVTDENGRAIDIPLGFLDNDAVYTARIYRDGKDAHWQKNPTSYAIESKEVTASDTLNIPLAPGGGAALHLWPKE